MKKLLVFLMIGVMFLTACGSETVSDREADEKEESLREDEDDNDDEDNNDEDAEEDENKADDGIMDKFGDLVSKKSFFAELPDSYYFSSGAGAWGTELYIEDDGSFYGTFHDSDMGSTGDGYPNGTVYVCDFEGKFTEPKQVSEYVYSTTIASMEIERAGEEYIEDGVKYIVTTPYGLDNAGEILIYLYGTPRNELPEGFLSWMMGGEMGPGDYLMRYGIYNVNEETAFTGSKIEEMSKLRKIGGTYVNEAGDKLVIDFDESTAEYDYDLGEVEWTPAGGVGEHGNIKINHKGGFTIYLGESISYDFEITDDTAGKIVLTRMFGFEEMDVFQMQ